MKPCFDQKIYTNRTMAFVLNYGSVIIMGISGLMMNALIALYYDSSVLGIFNETYAWYTIISQFSVMGIHMAVLKIVPEEEAPENKKRVLMTALIATLLTSVSVVVISEIIISLCRRLAWREALLCALPGLIFFSINKVLLNYLNAIYSFVSYALFQTLRYLGLIISTFLLSVLHVKNDYLGLIFPMSELILLIVMGVYLLSIKTMSFRNISVDGIRGIINFGMRIFPANIGIELNTKVDVVCLGLIVKDTAMIGVYSFAILFTEAFYMLYFTIRRIINPSIARDNSVGRLDDYVKEINTLLRKYLILGSVICILGLSFVYYTFVVVTKKEEYMIGILYIVIICVSMMINGKQIIWGDILNQTGHPLEESRINVLTVLSNIVLNIGCIVLFKTIGASIATGISHFVFGYSHKKAVSSKVGVDI